MAYVSFRWSRQGGIDVRTVEGVRGHIVRKQAVLTRPVSLAELHGIVCYVGRIIRAASGRTLN
jgi:hypothetical protein